jgi:hypothetical protein
MQTNLKLAILQKNCTDEKIVSATSSAYLRMVGLTEACSIQKQEKKQKKQKKSLTEKPLVPHSHKYQNDKNIVKYARRERDKERLTAQNIQWNTKSISER